MSTTGIGSAKLWSILKEKIGMLSETGRTDDAIRLAERLVEVARHGFDPTDPAIGESLELLGDHLAAAGRDGEAQPRYREAYELFSAANPHDDSRVIRVGAALAATDMNLGLAEEAAPIYSRILSLAESVMGGDNETVANLHNNYAIVLNALERDAEAETHYRKALDIYWAMNGPNDPLVALIYDHLGSFLLSRDRPDEAVKAYGRSLGIRQRRTDIAPQDLAQSYANLAVAHHAAADWEEAEAMYGVALETIGGESGAFASGNVAMIENYAALLRSLGKKRRAAALEKRLVKAASNVRG